ncbi:MAG: hypothetical protein AB8F78_16945 [Saprospiraceae bacterium]
MKNQMSRLLPVFAALLMMVFFGACEKDEITQTEENPITPVVTNTVTSPVASRIANNGTQTQSSSSTGGIEIECIEIDLPFDFDIDGVIYTITTLADFDAMFTNHFTANTMSADFVYPLDVTLEDGTAAVAADGFDLATFVSACTPGAGWGTGQFPAFFFDAAPCLSISYPVAMEDMDGTVITAVDEADFISILAANPALTFVFPLNVVDSSGAIVAVADETELFDLLAVCSCPGNGPGHGGTNGTFSIFGTDCFTIDYPINIIDFNGAVVSVADENAFSALVLNGGFADFEYSFTVTLVDGTSVTIADGDDFNELLNDCFGIVTYEVDALAFIAQSFVDSCYSLVYPFDIDVDGVTTTIVDETAASAFVNTNSHAGIIFPIDVVKGTQIITLANAQEYDDLISNCYGQGSGAVPASIFFVIAINDGSCYTLAYPVTTLNYDGTTSVLTSETEVMDYLMAQQDGIVQFPLDVIETATGSTLNLASEIDFFALLTSCQ